MWIFRKQSHQRFTLIELMVVLFIFSLLVGLAVPSFQGFIKRNRITTEVNRIVGNLNYARSEAVAQGQTITLAKASANNNDWSQGWQIYIDTDAAGNTAYDAASDTLLKDIGSSPPMLTVNSNAAGNPYISFRPNGMLNEGANTVTIAVCDNGADEQGRAITINLVGRVNIADTANCSP